MGHMFGSETSRRVLVCLCALQLWGSAYAAMHEGDRHKTHKHQHVSHLNWRSAPTDRSKPSRVTLLHEGPLRQELANFGDAQFTGEMKVGGQRLRGIFDTGSFELLVMSKRCQTCRVGGIGLFDGNRSNSYIAGDFQGQHAFGSGTMIDIEAYDNINLGPWVAKNQSFWEVVSAAMPILKDASFDAIVGIGPPESARKMAHEELKMAVKSVHTLEDMGRPVPQSLRKMLRRMQKTSDWHSQMTGLSDSLGLRRFSMCIGRTSGSPGYLTWNDKDPTEWPGTFVRVPVVGKIHWGVQLQSVRLRSQDGSDILEEAGSPELHLGCGASCAAVMDTGTSLIAAPSRVLMKLQSSLERLNADCSNLAELPELVFNLGGQEFSLPPESYIGNFMGAPPQTLWDLLFFKPKEMQPSCVPLFITLDKKTQYGPMWILGLPFFRHYYTTFDLGHGKGADRAIYAAPADDQCMPDASSHRALIHADGHARRKTVMNIDPMRVRVPLWLDEEEGAGSHLKI